MGEAFGTLDASTPQCVFEQTLIADTNTVFLSLPLEVFLENCSSVEEQQIDSDDESPRTHTDTHNSAAHAHTRTHDMEARGVPRKVGAAADHLEQACRHTHHTTPTLAQLLDAHSASGRNSEKSARYYIEYRTHL